MVQFESNVRLDPVCLGLGEMGCPVIRSKPHYRILREVWLFSMGRHTE